MTTISKIDFKKAEKQYYQPKKVELIEVPEMNYLTISGKGAPSSSNFQDAIAKLYPVAYTISMSYKREPNPIADFYPFVVPPLEGLWTSEEAPENGVLNKASFIWKIMIRMPEFVNSQIVEWAKAETALKKKDIDFSAVKFEQITDGLCVQAMHIGSFDNEPETFSKMAEFAEENNLKIVQKEFHHREIYLSDFQKTQPEKLKTVLRQYVE